MSRGVPLHTLTIALPERVETASPDIHSFPMFVVESILSSPHPLPLPAVHRAAIGQLLQELSEQLLAGDQHAESRVLECVAQLKTRLHAIGARAMSSVDLAELVGAALDELAARYFESGWDNVEPVLRANAHLEGRRGEEKEEDGRDEEEEEEEDVCVVELDGVEALEALLMDCTCEAVFVKFFSRDVIDSPQRHVEFSQAAAMVAAGAVPVRAESMSPSEAPTGTAQGEDTPQGHVVFAKLEGPKHPSLLQRFNVKSYPTMLLFRRNPEVLQCRPHHRRAVSSLLAERCFHGRVFEFPTEAMHDVEQLAYFAVHGGVLRSRPLARARWRRAISTVLGRIRYDKTTRLLRSQRKWRTIVEMFKALGATREDVLCTETARSHHRSADDPPTIIFLGGGMGAGKTSLVHNVIARSAFWKKHGTTCVVVEADALKMKDPVYQALADVTDDAAVFVHEHSTEAAEELFLSALRMRRDIIFDGTMSWYPFVEQTVAMVRDTLHDYKRGPGYKVDEDGRLVEETYWVRVEGELPASTVPYRVRMVGVALSPETAVRRGIMRKMSTGRAVPIPGQLRSHKLFAKSFPRYVELFDEVELYDNNDSCGGAPVLIAASPAGCPHLLTHTPLYNQFLRQAKLNPNASGLSELYPDDPEYEPTVCRRGAVQELKAALLPFNA